MRSAASNRGRHGVVLLVILGMLTMFAMVAVAFVILSGQARRGAENFRDMELRAVSPKDDLDGALAQVMRGSNSPASVMGAHSLLEDVYGANTRIGQIQNEGQILSTPSQAPSSSGNYNSPLLEFPILGASHPQFNGALSVTVRPSECIGCVLTFLNGPVAGVSTRIVACLPFDQTIGRPARFQVLAREDLTWQRLSMHFRNGTSSGNAGSPLLYVVNGAPFSGTGFGRIPAGASLGTATLDDTALLPNSLYNRPGAANISPYGARPFWGPQGGANEDYDAPDFQNMLLAMVNPLAVSSNTVPKVPIPSMHRAELCQYWQMRGGGGALQIVQYCMRPMPAAHPRFTGSNTSFNALWDGRGSGYQWDVDNDNDGVPDSIWVDLGMPARPSKDGRMCKPLFAIMCLDMDGRLNLNAHGSNIQTVAGYYQETNMGGDPLARGTRLQLRRGQGYGPAEINLRPLFERTAANAAQANSEYARLLRTTGSVPGRYGDGVPGVASVQGTVSPLFINREGASYAPLLPLPVTDLRTGAFDPNASSTTTPPIRRFGIAPFDLYGSAPDWDGNGVVAMDQWGWPRYFYMGESERFVVNLPYIFNLYAGRGPQALRFPQVPSGMNPNPGMATGYDAPFTPGELERLLRPYDSDTPLLPSRLIALSQPNATTISRLLQRRGEVTTESWDLPCPGVSIPVESRDFTTASTDKFAPGHILNLLRRRMAQARSTTTATGTPDMVGASIPDAQVIALAYQLLPPEVIAGQRMDINRVFGNGRDDTDNFGSNYVVDEPQEGFPGTSATAAGTYEPSTERVAVMVPNGSVGLVQSDPSNGQRLYVDQNGVRVPFLSKLRARQLYARQLYCLALLVLDSRLGTVAAADSRRRELAQWAVNMVDFRDRDSIMTRFDYDPNPFTGDGWNPPLPQANPAIPGKLDVCTVFGCERPELLITETLALHDHRTEDRDDETPVASPGGTGTPTAAKTVDAGTPAAGTTPDVDYDQRYVPQGSLFVELFNPWNPYDPVGAEYSSNPVDPLNQIGAGYVAGVNLAARTPVGNHPVWRLLITTYYPLEETLSGGTRQSVDLDRREREERSTWRDSLRRKVYFVRPDVSDPSYAFPQNEYKPVAGSGLTQCGFHWADPTNTLTPIAPILPGRYAVIGPADRTPSTSSTTSEWNRTYFGFLTSGLQGASTRQIMLTPSANPEARNAVQVLNNLSAGNDLAASAPPFVPPVRLDNGTPAIQWPVAIIVNHTNYADFPRLNISEPPDGYKLDAGVTVKADGTLSQILDIPLDDPTSRTDDLANVIQKHGLTDAVRIIHLQRLANPLMPFNDQIVTRGANNESYNPYITIDRMPVDLFVFDGLSSGGTTVATEFQSGTSPKIGVTICTRERGRRTNDAVVPATSVPRNLWWQDDDLSGPPPNSSRVNFGGASATSSSAAHVLTEKFDHTLGFCNFTYGGPTTKSAFVNVYKSALGFPDSFTTVTTGVDNPPFPWLNWNNRPFISQMEVMLVPQRSPCTLLAPRSMSLLANTTGGNYDSQDSSNTLARNNYRHLAPFFASSSLEQGVLGGFNAIQWHRMLEYLQVPSHFVGSQQQLPPDRMALAATGSNTPYSTHFFHPPFNWVSSYRDPGRVNINTIFSFDVFRGLLNNWLDIDYEGNALSAADTQRIRLKQMALWSKVVRSRKGSWSGNASMNEAGIISQALTFDLNVTDGNADTVILPSRFANPFRSYAGASLVPRQLLRTRSTLPHTKATPQITAIKILDEIEATLLRPDPDEINAATATTRDEYKSLYAQRQPLFRQRFLTGTPAEDDAQRSRRPWRNAYYQFDELQRLGNLVTTRSNVYAVWITVGYFEAYKKPINSDATLWPDGYELGAELGIDTGEVDRHRAFYLIDRSIPVGFMRGQDLNIDKAVLLRRFLE